MRLILAFALVALVLPTAAASGQVPPPDAGCDIDDDLYNHCHVGPVHWVTGPLCAGVSVKGPAACTGPGDVLGRT